MAEMQNANPTILSAADLPTRSRSTEKKAGDYELGIFAAVPKPADFLSSDSEGDEDLLEEPIDEQEIYGTQNHFLLLAIQIISRTPQLTLLRPNQIHLGPGTPALPRRTSRRLPPRYLHQAHPPHRPGLSSPNSHRPDHPHYHPLQSSHGHRPGSTSATRAIPPATLPRRRADQGGNPQYRRRG